MHDIEDRTNVYSDSARTTGPNSFIPPKIGNYNFVQSANHSEEEIEETKEGNSSSIKKQIRANYILRGISESQEFKNQSNSERKDSGDKKVRVVAFGDGQNYNIKGKGCFIHRTINHISINKTKIILTKYRI